MEMSVKQRKRRIETTIKLNHNKYLVYQLKLNLTSFYSVSSSWHALAAQPLVPGCVFVVAALYRVSQKFVPLLYKSVTQYNWT